MLDIFSGLRLVVKRRSISIDNAIFRCHWFFTSTLLVSFSLIITARQYVGQPIECHGVNKIPDTLLNSYCWVQSTFSVPQACNQQVGLDVPYPCIDNTRGREIKVYNYYQWVGMVLFIQGLLFHLPYYLWKVWENGLIRAITGGLRVAVLSDQERAKKKDIVVEYIHDHLGCHRPYALKYFLCEFICLVNLLIQLWATNNFFDGQFLRYGIDVMQYSSTKIASNVYAYNPNSNHPSSSHNPIHDSSSSMEPSNKSTEQHEQYQALSRSLGRPHSSSSSHQFTNEQRQLLAKYINPQAEQERGNSTMVDPMTYIFPRITKCTYYDFGSSGDIQKHDALCLLPLNIINEKIYIALWFWFLILAQLTLLVILYRLISIVSESVRCTGLISRCKLSSERDIRIICRHCDVGDWFLFYMIAENLDPLIMREIIADIAMKIRDHFALKQELGMMPVDHLMDPDFAALYAKQASLINTMSEQFNQAAVAAAQANIGVQCTHDEPATTGDSDTAASGQGAITPATVSPSQSQRDSVVDCTPSAPLPALAAQLAEPSAPVLAAALLGSASPTRSPLRTAAFRMSRAARSFEHDDIALVSPPSPISSCTGSGSNVANGGRRRASCAGLPSSAVAGCGTPPLLAGMHGRQHLSNAACHHNHHTAHLHNQAAAESPLVKKLSKRLYSRRLWSIDLGNAAEMRQQLLGSMGASPGGAHHAAGSVQQQAQSTSLGGAPPCHAGGGKRAATASQRQQQQTSCALSRVSSSESSSGVSSASGTNDSFVMEMHDESGSGDQAHRLDNVNAPTATSAQQPADSNSQTTRLDMEQQQLLSPELLATSTAHAHAHASHLYNMGDGQQRDTAQMSTNKQTNFTMKDLRHV